MLQNNSCVAKISKKSQQLSRHAVSIDLMIDMMPTDADVPQS